MDKKEIAADWTGAFPTLRKMTQNRFCEVLGPLVLGIELIKLPRIEEYRPHFVIYALWGSRMGIDIKSCFVGPIVLKQYYNKIGRQLDIPYNKHIVYFDEAVQCVKEQTPLQFGENISLKEMLFIFDDYSKSPPLKASSDSFLQAMLQEYKIKIALFTGDFEEAKRILEYARNVDWDAKNFNYFRAEISQWLNNLQELINQPEIILDIVLHNKQEKEIKKLNSLQII